MSNKTLDRAYTTINQYVKRVRFGSTFTTNALRERLDTTGLSPRQYSGVISGMVRNGVIIRIGTTRSDDPSHNGGWVSIYTRGYNS